MIVSSTPENPSLISPSAICDGESKLNLVSKNGDKLAITLSPDSMKDLTFSMELSTRIAL